VTLPLRRVLASALAPGLVALAALVAFVRAGQTAALRVTVDADTLYGPLLARDLREWGGRLAEWNLPPSAGWFPDLALLWGALALGVPGPRAMQLAGEVLLGMALVGWLVVARRRATLLVIFALGLVLVMPLSALLGAGVQLESHGGLAAAAPWTIVLGRSSRRSARCAQALLVAAVVASDALALPMLVLPFVALARTHPRRSALTTLAAALVGLLLATLLRERPVLASYLDVSPLDSWRSLVMFGRWVGHFVRHEPASALLVLASALVLLARGRVPGPTQALARFALGSVVVTVATLIVFGQFLDLGGARYVLPALLGMCCVAAIVGVDAASKPRPAALGLTGLGLGLATAAIPVASPAPVVRSELLEPLERELAARGLHAGAAPYWDAKVLTYLSRRGTFVTSLAPDRVLPYPWNANAFWALRHPPEFLLVSSDDAAHERDALRLFGVPAERIAIGDRLLLTYADRDVIKVHFAPYAVDFTVPGASASFPVAAGEADAALGLAYRGPHLMVPPGRYRLGLASSLEPPVTGTYRIRAGRRARLEGSLPAPGSLVLEVPRAAPLTIELYAASPGGPGRGSVSVTRLP